MRVIGGRYKGQKLSFLKTKKTRPTADMVKEAVFNMLEINPKTVVLDLFSGSGSYGIEAISKGADQVYFNDHDPACFQMIKKNLKTLGVEAKVFNKDYLRTITYFEEQSFKFDLIFLDPPYYEGLYQAVLAKLIPILKKCAKVVVELDKNLEIFVDEINYQIIKNKTYGKKRILILEKTN